MALTHSPIATAISLVVDELPWGHHQQFLLGGAIQVAPFEVFGGAGVAAAGAEALVGWHAAIHASHGTRALGADHEPGHGQCTAAQVGRRPVQASAGIRVSSGTQRRAAEGSGDGRAHKWIQPTEDGAAATGRIDQLAEPFASGCSARAYAEPGSLVLGELILYWP